MMLMAYDNRLSANLTQRIAGIQLQRLLADGVVLPAKQDENIVFVFAVWKKNLVHQLLCTGKLCPRYDDFSSSRVSNALSCTN